MASDTDSGVPPLSDEQLTQLADESFVELDRGEAVKTDDMPQLCSKCGGRMEQGFILDRGAAEFTLRGRYVSKWARGAPLKSFLFKTWVPWDALPIGAFRCASCGYLESYARDEFGAKRQTQFSLRSLLVFVTVVSIVLGLIAWAARS